MATYAWVTTCSILLAAVNAATSVDPRMLRDDWTIIVPIAVMEYWSAIGIPIRSWIPRSEPDRCQSSLCRRRAGTAFTMYPRQRSPDIPCEMTVATAAPAVPMWKKMMRTRSSTILSSAERIRKYRGTLLFPSALNILASRL